VFSTYAARAEKKYNISDRAGSRWLNAIVTMFETERNKILKGY
jgi:hypothetical protein